MVKWGGFFRGVRISCANIEKCCLLCSMFAQFGHLIYTAFDRLLLSSLVPSLCLVSLSLLPCVFFLAFCKR